MRASSGGSEAYAGNDDGAVVQADFQLAHENALDEAGDDDAEGDDHPRVGGDEQEAALGRRGDAMAGRGHCRSHGLSHRRRGRRDEDGREGGEEGVVVGMGVESGGRGQ